MLWAEHQYLCVAGEGLVVCRGSRYWIYCLWRHLSPDCHGMSTVWLQRWQLRHPPHPHNTISYSTERATLNTHPSPPSTHHTRQTLSQPAMKLRVMSISWEFMCQPTSSGFVSIYLKGDNIHSNSSVNCYMLQKNSVVILVWNKYATDFSQTKYKNGMLYTNSLAYKYSRWKELIKIMTNWALCTKSLV